MENTKNYNSAELRKYVKDAASEMESKLDAIFGRLNELNTESILTAERNNRLTKTIDEIEKRNRRASIVRDVVRGARGVMLGVGAARTYKYLTDK